MTTYPAVSPFLLVADARTQCAFLAGAFDAVELRRFERPDGSVQHVEMLLEDCVVMIGERPAANEVRCSTHVYVADVDATHAKALAAGGRSIVAPTTRDYGDRSAGVADPHGNLWWIGTPVAALPQRP